MFQIKMKKGEHSVRWISLIRRYYPALSIGEIRQRMETDSFVVTQEPVPRYDPVDEERGTDRLMLFCELLDVLEQQGAAFTLFEDGEPMTRTMFCSRLKMLQEIERQTELDMEREANEPANL